MKEDFLHYIWKGELFNKNNLKTDMNDSVEVISTGIHNLDEGPDFINARIKINNTIWAGNVEIHTDSANWTKHKHHTNKTYNNVILHVVDSVTAPSFRQNGEQIPTLALNYNKELLNKYESLISSDETIPCQNEISSVDDFTFNMSLESLCIERLEQKTEYINDIFRQTNNNWEETYYIMLARNFGFNTNALPFEMLAKATPLKLLSKYHNNLFQIESILFGQAGFLDKDIEYEFYKMLKKEYQYMQKAHKLEPIENHIWKFLRLRPSNFPTIRIAQFASLIHKSSGLFSKTIEAQNLKELLELYSCKTSDFWEEHYTFSSESKRKAKQLGKPALLGILINTVIPFLFIYGKSRLQDELTDKALSLLNEIPAEQNIITRSWNKIGITPVNASQSQALIQLTKNYCKPKNCLYCQIGNELIRNKL